MIRDEIFKAIFYPKNIAVVGASSDPRKPGGMYMQNLVSWGFQGRIYPVNSQDSEILGLKTYRDMNSIPEPVDYVICCVPRRLVLDVLDDCSGNGAKVVQFFTAGFRETGEREGMELEDRIRERAREKHVRILGPNCAGVGCPAHRRAYGPLPFPLNPEVGEVSFISHSSGLVANVIEAGIARGIKFSKLGAFNNCCDLNELDFLNYVGNDPETKIIGAYLEGTKNGRRLFQLMKEIAKIKPLIIWKGGQTEAGVQAAALHTASLTNSTEVWNAAVKQSGAIPVSDLEELIDSLLSFQSISSFSGSRVAIITGFNTPGGGDCVTSADECISWGLKVPPFTNETKKKLNAMLGTTGTILRNPLDMGLIKDSIETLKLTLEVINNDPGIDVIMFKIWLSWFRSFFSPLEIKELLKCLKEFREGYKKPLVVICHSTTPMGMGSEDMKGFDHREIPNYPTVARATKALVNMKQYFENRERN